MVREFYSNVQCFSLEIITVIVIVLYYTCVLFVLLSKYVLRIYFFINFVALAGHTRMWTWLKKSSLCVKDQKYGTHHDIVIIIIIFIVSTTYWEVVWKEVQEGFEVFYGISRWSEKGGYRESLTWGLRCVIHSVGLKCVCWRDYWFIHWAHGLGHTTTAKTAVKRMFGGGGLISIWPTLTQKYF